MLNLIWLGLLLFGVLVAGLIIALTHNPLADPAVSLLIAGFILWSSYDVARDSATVLLEGTPPGTDMSAVVAAIKSVASREGSRLKCLMMR